MFARGRLRMVQLCQPFRCTQPQLMDGVCLGQALQKPAELQLLALRALCLWVFLFLGKELATGGGGTFSSELKSPEDEGSSAISIAG